MRKPPPAATAAARAALASALAVTVALPAGTAASAEAPSAARQKIDQVSVVEAPGWRGATRAHSRSYVTEEQRSQPGWFGRPNLAEILTGGTSPYSAARPTVVLFTPASPDPLAARLEAELTALGIAVRPVESPPDRDFDTPARSAIAAGAGAAIRVVPRSMGTEVWTADTTAKVLRRRAISSDAATSEADLALVALRTVELVRASLLDFRRGATQETPAAGPPDETRTQPPSDEKRDKAKPPRPPEGATADTGPAYVYPANARFEVAAGPGVLASSGGVSPQVGASVTARVRVLGRAGLEVMVLLPIASPRIDGPGGTIRMAVTVLAAGGYLRLAPPGRFVFDVAAGAAAIAARATGTPSMMAMLEGWTAEDEQIWVAALHGRAGAAFNIAGPVSLRVDAFAGGTLTRTGVQFNGSSTVAWGRPFAGGVLALAATF